MYDTVFHEGDKITSINYVKHKSLFSCYVKKYYIVTYVRDDRYMTMKIFCTPNNKYILKDFINKLADVHQVTIKRTVYRC